MNHKTYDELKVKLNSIGKPKVVSYASGEAANIKTFWEEFIKPSDDYVSAAREWHRVLMTYIADIKRRIFPIRGCERHKGYLTKINQDCCFVYTDNEHAKYYLKMCADGFVPSVDALQKSYENYEFPITEFSIGERAAFRNIKKHGYNDAGYYLAHIFAVGEYNYYYDGEESTHDEIENKYFYDGDDDYWIKNDRGKYYRTLSNVSNPNRAIDYLIAMFLRYVHPFNYFLTPNPDYIYSCDVKIPGKKENNIGEYHSLVKYIQYKYSQLYGDDYNEFLSKIMVKKSDISDINIGSKYEYEFINLKYYSPSFVNKYLEEQLIRKFLTEMEYSVDTINEILSTKDYRFLETAKNNNGNYYKETIKINGNNYWIRKKSKLTPSLKLKLFKCIQKHNS